jgi:putative MATE family efflux protein
MITMSLRLITEGTMQASGDALTPMRIGLIFRAVHIVLCPLLVFGLGPFPNMGVSGAAVTNVISQGLGGALGLWVLLSGRTGLRLTFSNFRIDSKMIWRMLKIGIPNLLTGVQHFISVLALTWFISPFGTLAVASHTLWQRIDQVLVTLGMGMGSSAGILGAQNLGANRPERAQKSAWLAAVVDLGIMIIGSAAILLWAEKMVAIFTSDVELIKMTSTFLRISSASYFMLGLNVVFMQFLVGVGDTITTLLIEISRAWVVQISLAFFLSKYTSFGVYGVRWSIVAGFIFGGVAFILYFRLGKWKRKQV